MPYPDEDTSKEVDRDSSIEFDDNARCWRHIVGNLVVGIGVFISVPPMVILARSLWNLVILEENLPVSPLRYLALRYLATLAIAGLAWIVAGLLCRRGRFWMAISAFAIGYVLLALGLPDR